MRDDQPRVRIRIAPKAQTLRKLLRSNWYRDGCGLSRMVQRLAARHERADLEGFPLTDYELRYEQWVNDLYRRTYADVIDELTKIAEGAFITSGDGGPA